MPANPSAYFAIQTERDIDGVLLAPVDRRPWSALQELRAGMAELRQAGFEPRLAFVLALSRRGRIVPGRSGEAEVFVLAYRLADPT